MTFLPITAAPARPPCSPMLHLLPVTLQRLWLALFRSSQLRGRQRARYDIGVI